MGCGAWRRKRKSSRSCFSEWILLLSSGECASIPQILRLRNAVTPSRSARTHRHSYTGQRCLLPVLNIVPIKHRKLKLNMNKLSPNYASASVHLLKTTSECHWWCGHTLTLSKAATLPTVLTHHIITKPTEVNRNGHTEAEKVCREKNGYCFYSCVKVFRGEKGKSWTSDQSKKTCRR